MKEGEQGCQHFQTLGFCILAHVEKESVSRTESWNPTCSEHHRSTTLNPEHDDTKRNAPNPTPQACRPLNANRVLKTKLLKQGRLEGGGPPTRTPPTHPHDRAVLYWEHDGWPSLLREADYLSTLDPGQSCSGILSHATTVRDTRGRDRSKMHRTILPTPSVGFARTLLGLDLENESRVAIFFQGLRRHSQLLTSYPPTGGWQST